MKRTLLLSAFLLCSGIFLLKADDLPGSQSDFNTEMMKTALSQNRMETFKKAMSGLPSADQEKFWEQYKIYSDEKNKLDSARITVYDQYMTNYLRLDNDKALKLMDKLIKLQQDELKLRVKTFKRLSAKVSPLVATRFYQVDDFLQAALKIETLGRIPIFGDQIK